MKKKKLKRRCEELKAQMAEMQQDIRAIVMDESFEGKELAIARWKGIFQMQDFFLQGTPILIPNSDEEAFKGFRGLVSDSEKINKDMDSHFDKKYGIRSARQGNSGIDEAM